MEGNKENIIVNRSFEFALEVISYCEILEEKKKFVIARQLLKSDILSKIIGTIKKSISKFSN